MIVGRGYLPIGIKYVGVVAPQRLYYTLKLSFKDGKYKYELTDFYFENEPAASQHYQVVKVPGETMLLGSSSSQSSWEEKTKAQYRAQFEATIPGIIAGLKAGMLKSTDF